MAKLIIYAAAIFAALGSLYLFLPVLLRSKKRPNDDMAFVLRDGDIERGAAYFFPKDYKEFNIWLIMHPRRKEPEAYHEYLNQFYKLLAEKCPDYSKEVDKKFIKNYFSKEIQ